MPENPRGRTFDAELVRVDRRGIGEERKVEQVRSPALLWREIKRAQAAEVDVQIQIEAKVILS